MLSAKHQAITGAVALCLCAPLSAQAHDQDLRGADARGAPTAAERPYQAQPAPPIQIVEVPSSGFEWGDAGIGAAGTLALVLMASGAGAAIVRHRGSQAQ